MSNNQRLDTILKNFVGEWEESPVSKRVTEVEGLAITTGRASQWTGQSIPEFWLNKLQELTTLLRENPELLEDDSPAAKLKEFLAEEQILIDEADRLTEKLESYILGPLDPRYHRDQKKLREVIDDFRLTNKDYQLNWTAFPKG
jgi:hypothetical protein